MMTIVWCASANQENAGEGALPETEALIQKLMEQRGISVPPPIRSSVCLAFICSGNDP